MLKLTKIYPIEGSSESNPIIIGNHLGTGGSSFYNPI